MIKINKVYIENKIIKKLLMCEIFVIDHFEPNRLVYLIL